MKCCLRSGSCITAARAAIASSMRQACHRLRDAVPDNDTTKKILTKYIDLILSDIEEVKKEKEKIEIGSSSKNYTSYTVSLDGKELSHILKDVVREVKTDEDILKIVDDALEILSERAEERGSEYSFDLSRDSFIDICDTLAGSLEEYGPGFFGEGFSVDYTVWVDFFGDVKGRELKVGSDEDDLLSTRTMEIKDEKEIRVSIPMSALAFGVHSDAVICGSTEDGRFSGTGSVLISLGGEKKEMLKLAVSDVDEDGAARGEYNGKITVKAGDDLVSGRNSNYSLGLGATETMAIKNVTVDADLKYSDLCQTADVTVTALNLEIGKMHFSCDTNEVAGELKLPEDCVVITDSESLAEWVCGWDIDSFCEKVNDSGLPEELCESVYEFFISVRAFCDPNFIPEYLKELGGLSQDGSQSESSSSVPVRP